MRLKPKEPWMLLSSRTKEQDAKIQAGFRALEEAKKQKDPTTGINEINPAETVRIFDTQIQELEALAERLQDEAERAQRARNEDVEGGETNGPAAQTEARQGEHAQVIRGSQATRLTAVPAQTEASAQPSTEALSFELQQAEQELASSETDLDRRHIIYRRVVRDRDGYFYRRLQNAGPMYDVDAPPPLTTEDRLQSAQDVVTAILTRYTDRLADNRSEVMNTYRLSEVTVDLLIRHQTVFSETTTASIENTLEQAQIAMERQVEAERQSWEQDMGLSPVVDTGADDEEEQEAQEEAESNAVDTEEVHVLLEQVRSERARYIQEVRDVVEQRRIAIERTLQLPVSHTEVRAHTGFKGDNFFGHTDDSLRDADYALRDLRHDLEMAKEEREDVRRHQRRLDVAEIEGLVRQFGRPSTLFGELALKADTKKGVSMLHLGRGVEDARKQAIADMVIVLEKEGDIDALLPPKEKSAAAEAVLRNPQDLIARAKALNDEGIGRRSDRARDIQARREFIEHLEACETWANELQLALAQYDQILDAVAWLNRPPQPPLPPYTPGPPRSSEGPPPPPAPQGLPQQDNPPAVPPPRPRSNGSDTEAGASKKKLMLRLPNP